jgi:hypothetical protein
MTPYVKNNISTLLVNALATIPSPARIPPITVHHLNENEVLISPILELCKYKITYKITIHCTFIKHIMYSLWINNKPNIDALYLRCPVMVDLLVIEDIISLKVNLCYLLILHWFTHRVFSGVTQSLVLYVCFVDHCLSFCTFSFGHCVVCSSLIYGF